jgi:hypothetical protein
VTDHTAPQAAAWVDGDPLMEAIAAAVWEQCRTDYPSSVVDDPRNIAAVAASVARAQQPAELTRAQAEAYQYRTALQGAARRSAAPAVQAPATDRAALRDRIIAALDNAHHTHPCPELGDQTWSGCVHHDEVGRVVGVGSCHSGRRADAVLAVLPAPTDRAASPGAFVLWLDALDGSVPTHDGIQWPDGTVTIHHRHFGITTTHHSAEAACQAAHGKQGRIVWPERAPTDRAAVLHEAADRITRQADQLWAPGTRAHTVMYADAAELRRAADEAQQPGEPW